jgi:predicted DNA-binding antitoxin AbrB/MazE fold protein
MSRYVEAVYEKGVLRPLQPLNLPESEHVMLEIIEIPNEDIRDYEVMDWALAQVPEKGHVRTREEMRAALSTVSASFSRTVIDDRGDD